VKSKCGTERGKVGRTNKVTAEPIPLSPANRAYMSNFDQITARID